MSTMTTNDAVLSMEPSQYARKQNTIKIDEKEIPAPSGAYKRPGIGRRQTTDGFGRRLEEESQPPIARFFSDLMENEIARYAIYILPVAALLAIPLVLYCTKFEGSAWEGTIPSNSSTIVSRSTTSANATASQGDKVIRIHKRGFMLWLELCWAFLWIAKILATILPSLFWTFCGLITTGLRKYALVLKAVKTPLSIFLWAILCIASYNVIYVFDRDQHAGHTGENNPITWLVTFHKVLKVSTGMSALWLSEKMLVQLVSVNYHSKAHHDKIKGLKKTSRAIDLLYEASLRRFRDLHPDFLEEDIEIHDSSSIQETLRHHSAAAKTRRFLGTMAVTADRVTTAFGRIASDITGQEVLKPTATHAIVEQALARKSGSHALANRIFRSLCPFASDVITEHDLVAEFGHDREAEARWIFSQLDRDGNGDVSLDEMVMLITGVSQERDSMWKNACDIKDAIKILDLVLSFIVFFIVCLFYAAFFSTFLQTKANSIWVFFSGSAFAIAGTVSQFNACLVFIFIAHPYDVGDRVNILMTEYEVFKISLMYSVFKRVDNGTLVNVSNQTLASTWIENVSRSPAMKERLTFSVSAGTTFDDIESLRAELEKFVQDPAHSRHFFPEIDIQLLSVGDLKQLDLRVEILHKSNWAVEKLRAERRSRFMCALLSAMRRVHIDGPAGSAPGQGTINNPNYSVSITDDAAKASRAKFDADKAAILASRVQPQGNDTAQSSGLEILHSLRRRSIVVAEGMGRNGSVSQGTTANPFGVQWNQSSLEQTRPTNYPPRQDHAM